MKLQPAGGTAFAAGRAWKLERTRAMKSSCSGAMIEPENTKENEG